MDDPRHHCGTQAAPTALQIERQMSWEMHSTERGVDRYRAEVGGSAMADTNPGKLAMRDMLGDGETKGLVKAIKDAQDVAVAGITAAEKGRPAAWWWLISFLPADKLGVIVARSVMSRTTSTTATGQRATEIASEIGRNVKTEIEFEMWRRSSKEAHAEGRTERDLFKVLTSKTKKVDAKAFARWKKKIAEIERVEWTREQRLHIGTFLLDMLVTQSGGWFEMRIVYSKGKTERQIFLTDVAKTAIGDIHQKLEVSRPYLLPMICPPKPWKRGV